MRFIFFRECFSAGVYARLVNPQKSLLGWKLGWVLIRGSVFVCRVVVWRKNKTKKMNKTPSVAHWKHRAPCNGSPLNGKFSAIIAHFPHRHQRAVSHLYNWRWEETCVVLCSLVWWHLHRRVCNFVSPPPRCRIDQAHCWSRGILNTCSKSQHQDQLGEPK